MRLALILTHLPLMIVFFSSRPGIDLGDGSLGSSRHAFAFMRKLLSVFLFFQKEEWFGVGNF